MNFLLQLLALFGMFVAFILLGGGLVAWLWEAFGSTTQDPEHGERNQRRLIWLSFLIVFAVFAWLMMGTL